MNRWGVENAASFGRHLSTYLIEAGHDVRDVPPHRTANRGKGRHQGKSDLLDSHRMAQETQTNSQLAGPFKNSEARPADPTRELMALWHNARKSLTRVRVQLLGEIDMLIHDLPEDLRDQIAVAKTVRAKINAFQRLDPDHDDPAVQLRLRLLRSRIDMLTKTLEQDRVAATELETLVRQKGSTLTDLVGIAPRAAAEILVEVGDIERFTRGGFARYTGTAPVPASSGEGGGQPVRHRLSRGGNRRLNAVLHRMAMIQFRYEPRAQTLFDNARAAGHTRREAMRILKRHLSDVIYRTMVRDARYTQALTLKLQADQARRLRVPPLQELPDPSAPLRRQAQLGPTRHRHTPLNSEEPPNWALLATATPITPREIRSATKAAEEIIDKVKRGRAALTTQIKSATHH